MRRIEHWLLALTIAGSSLVGTTTAEAQVRVIERTRNDDARRRPPPPPSDNQGPREAPPPPRVERQAARAGYTWIDGKWEWRGNKWEWKAGTWERERAGKKWKAGTWEKRGDVFVYVDGSWNDAPSAPPDDRPREAPPSPREERQAERRGYTWIPGRWDWRNRKWEWAAGRWERERAGERWEAGRWDRQGDVYVWVEGKWAGGAPPPNDDDRPREAPPSPREERIAARAGFTWIAGRWDWRNRKWEWVEGRWEKERAGKQWRAARWEQRDGRFFLVDGEWIDATGGTGSPPYVPPGRGDPRDPRGPRGGREWRLDRPVVSSYWPVKGKIGTRVTIRGRNFPNDAAVLWAGTQVNGAKVTEDAITVIVPPGAVSGPIAVRAGRGRDLLVGGFEVADGYDAVAEARKREAEERARAEAAWTARQRELARDRAAREAASQRRWEERESSREERRQRRLEELRQKWKAAFLADAETQSELTLHSQRVAELDRMREIAEINGNGKLVVRVGVIAGREEERHEARMAALYDSFGRTP